MSKSTFGWRQAGFAGVAAALVAGGALVGMGAANAAATTLTAASTPAVSPGTAGAPAGNLKYTFDNAFTAGAAVTFSIAGNDCSTPAAIAKATEYSAAPTALVTVAANSPVAGPAVLSSSSAACNTAGIQDVATVTLPAASTGDPADRFDLNLSAITYNVGADAALGNITVNAVGTNGLGNASAVNAIVRGTGLSVDGMNATTPFNTNVALSTATIKESASEASFPAGSRIVTLRLDNGASFNTSSPASNVDVSVTAGHTISNRNFNAGKFSFTVNTPAVVPPATVPAATITVKGLRANAAAVAQVNLKTDIGTIPPGVKILNVVNTGNRVAGHDRYDTAVDAFNTFNGGGNNDNAILANGVKFADALSANYLAGSLGTGTLLTEADSLPTAVKNAIINAKVKTVYIVGGNLAVSQAVENQITAIGVGDKASNKHVQVIRLQGQTRYDTNKAINESVNSGSSDTVLLATGAEISKGADALTLGPISYKQQYPLVLNDPTNSATALGQINDFNAKNVVIAGGTLAVPASVQTALDNDGIKTARLENGDRFGTAAQVATWATTGLMKADGVTPVDGVTGINQGFNSSNTFVSNGQNSHVADALSVGPVAGDNNSVLLLSSSASTIAPQISDYLGTKKVKTNNNGKTIGTVTLVGGTLATTNGLVNTVKVAIEK